MKPDGEHWIRFSKQIAQEFKTSTPATAFRIEPNSLRRDCVQIFTCQHCRTKVATGSDCICPNCRKPTIDVPLPAAEAPLPPAVVFDVQIPDINTPGHRKCVWTWSWQFQNTLYRIQHRLLRVLCVQRRVFIDLLTWQFTCANRLMFGVFWTSQNESI